MKKRIISIALTFVMLLAMIPSVSVTAATAATYDWYDGQTEYVLDSVGDLLGFANIVNGADGKTADTFAEKTVKLGGDINMAGESWTPINGFAGTFDGNEKTISNLTYNDSTQINSYYCFGFFASCSGATVQNLTLDTVSVSRTTEVTEYVYAGGLVAQITGNFTATNVTVNALTVNLNYTGNGIKPETAIGGIVGCVASDADAVSLTNCDVTNLNITVSAKQTNKAGMGVGGLVGRSQVNIFASDCEVTGAIKATKSAQWRLGGFCGKSLGAEVSYNECSATVNLDGSDSDNSYAKPAIVGGFVGEEKATTATYTACSYEGAVKGRLIGGCVGNLTSTMITLDTCNIDANVVVNYTNSGTGAGLFAQIGDTTAVLDNVTVKGSVTGGDTQTKLELYPEELFSASSQVHAAKDTGYFAQTKYDATNVLDIRLVNSISTTDGVDKLGYVTVLKYTNADGEKEIKIMSGDTDKVYTGITAAGIEKTATDLGGEYIYIAEIPGYKGTSNLTVEVTPYYINSDGNTVYATTATYLLSSEGSALAGSDTVEKKTA